jgi:hypothetical protein
VADVTVDISALPEVKDEGRWVLMTETLFLACVAALEARDGVSVDVAWGQPETRFVTFSTPNLTVTKETP